MARLVSHPVRGLAKQLLSATASLHSPEPLLQLPLVAAHALRVPFQQCLLHSPAYGAHSYHGSRDDDDSSNSKASGSAGQTASEDDNPPSNGAGSSNRANSNSSKVTEQLKALQEAIEQVTESVQAGQQAREAAQLPEHVARHAMRDPLGMLMTSRGVPLGISLKVNPETFFKQRQQQQSQREAEADRQDWQELLGNSSSSSSMQGSDEHHTSVPSTDAQLLRVKLIKAAKKLVTAGKTSSKRSSGRSSSPEAASSSSSAASGASNSSIAASSSSDSSSSSSADQGTAAQRQTTVGQQAKEQLAHLLASADSDSWGTTQQSPAQIAQQIADSNRAASGGGGGGDGDDEGDGEGGDDEEPLTLSAVEERYADQDVVTAELKEMDEIYAVLAKVPWLDDGDVDERELRGVVAVGLLGTLEEVGWQLREKLLCLWAGERDLDVLTDGVGPREAAALTAILYHTEQLEREFDKPPAAGVAAALAAAGGDPVQAGTVAAAGDGAESGSEAKN